MLVIPESKPKLFYFLGSLFAKRSWFLRWYLLSRYIIEAIINTNIKYIALSVSFLIKKKTAMPAQTSAVTSHTISNILKNSLML